MRQLTCAKKKATFNNCYDLSNGLCAIPEEECHSVCKALVSVCVFCWFSSLFSIRFYVALSSMYVFTFIDSSKLTQSVDVDQYAPTLRVWAVEAEL